MLDFSGLLHRSTLTQLTPGAIFWYRCCKTGASMATAPMRSSRGGGDGVCDGVKETTRVFAARAAPHKGALPLTIAAVADLGEDCFRPDPWCGNNTCGCGNATIAALAEGATSGEFAAIVHAGDIAYTSGNQAIWDEYMREMEPAVSAVPYQVAPGNHEHYYNFSGYLHRFSMLADDKTSINNLYNSFDIGGVHFVAFSTEHDYSPGSPQVQWMAADLAKVDRSVTPWVVVFAHRPIYCSTSDFFDCQTNGPKNIGPSIEPILAKNRVDLYLAGHLHNYERTWPTYNGVVAARSYTNVTATVHVVVGMAGCDEGLTGRFADPSPDWSATHSAQLGWAKMHFASATEMTLSYVLSNTGEVFDTFTITRPVPT